MPAEESSTRPSEEARTPEAPAAGGPRRPGSNHPNRLCLVTYPYIPSRSTGRGVDRYAEVLRAGLAGRGVDVRVVPGGGRVHGPLDLLRNSARFLVRLARTRAPLYHAVDPLGAVGSIVLGKRPLIATVHDVLPFEPPSLLDPRPHRLRFYGMRLAIHLAAHFAMIVTVPFDTTAAALRIRCPSVGRRLRVVRYGLTPLSDEARPAPNAPPALEAVGSTTARLLFIGGGQPIVRGGVAAVRLLTELRGRKIAARLTMVVQGPEVPLVRAEVERCQQTDVVQLLDEVPEAELSSFLRRFDLFVYLSRLGFSFLALQAMMVGTPVLASASQDMPEFLDGGGLVADRDDPVAVADAAMAILGSPERRAAWTARSLDRARAFRAEGMIASFLEVYAEASTPPAS